MLSNVIKGIDIETIPNQSLKDEDLPQFDPEIVKVGNIKDQKKIDAKVKNERANFNDKLNKSMSLDPDLCQVVAVTSIQFNILTGKVVRESTLTATRPYENEMDDSELIIPAVAEIEEAYNNRVPIVTFNGQGFDIPIIIRRAMITGVQIDKVVYEDIMKRYKKLYHYDLMQLMANWDKSKWKSLDYYLRRFQIGEKSHMTGADVYPAYQAGEFEAIGKYNHDEVLMLCKLCARIHSWLI